MARNEIEHERLDDIPSPLDGITVLDEADRAHYYRCVMAAGYARKRAQGRDFSEADFLAGAMIAYWAFGAWGSLPAGWVFGPLGGRSVFGEEG